VELAPRGEGSFIRTSYHNDYVIGTEITREEGSLQFLRELVTWSARGAKGGRLHRSPAEGFLSEKLGNRGTTERKKEREREREREVGGKEVYFDETRRARTLRRQLFLGGTEIREWSEQNAGSEKPGEQTAIKVIPGACRATREPCLFPFA